MSYTRSWNIFGWLASVIVAAFSGIGAFVGKVWSYIEPSPNDALALDRMAHAISCEPERMSPFKAFVARALGHADYTAGHFDPGRSFA